MHIENKNPKLNCETKHLISIEDLTKSQIFYLVERALYFLKIKNQNNPKILEGETCFNIFFENSTRTASSFASALACLGANVLNISKETSSASKGETDFDTICNISRLNPKFITIRHPENMFPHLCSKLQNINKNSIILNAGDGINEHPSQALGDLFLITEEAKKAGKKLNDLKIVLFGDLKRSRVAHSHIKIFNMLGLNSNIHLAAPIELSLDYRCIYNDLNYHLNLNDAIKDADVIMAFRFKKEYNCEKNLNVHEGDLKNFYQLNHSNICLAKKDVFVLHAGPVNRNLELSSELVDDLKYSKIFDQVEFGLAMRKAIIELLLKIN